MLAVTIRITLGQPRGALCYVLAVMDYGLLRRPECRQNYKLLSIVCIWAIPGDTTLTGSTGPEMHYKS